MLFGRSGRERDRHRDSLVQRQLRGSKVWKSTLGGNPAEVSAAGFGQAPNDRYLHAFEGTRTRTRLSIHLLGAPGRHQVVPAIWVYPDDSIRTRSGLLESAEGIDG